MTKEDKIKIAEHLEKIVRYMKDKANPAYNKCIEDAETLMKEFRSSDDDKETT